ncbi:methionine synthase reductase [Ceratitis capitata]|uniref:methionine synthase reductase n=1 Tax=Ceratitis capitata TaxID=7213 RepID=UPI000329CAF6|nr:methionine synthase reductase [Ceratitis capitata]
MVCPTEIPFSEGGIININNFILDKYVPAKLSEPIYSALYANEDSAVKAPTKHAQLLCTELIWPFSRAGALPLEVPIKTVKVLAEGDDEIKAKRILELAFEMKTLNNSHQPGDTIAILPMNNVNKVQKLLQQMQLLNSAETTFQLQISSKCMKKNVKLPTYIPTLCTPYQLLRDCINIHAVPKKQFLSVLASCCSDVNEKAFLSCLSSKEASCYYNELILERGLTLLDLLELCPSCTPTLEILIEHLPRLLPRPYSLANNPLTDEVKIIFSILPQKTGVTTDMLNTFATLCLKNINIPEPPKIVVYSRQTNHFCFTVKEASEHNHILICVGTALAPFLGFLELKEQLLGSKALESLGDTWLFAGAVNEAYLPHRERILAYEEAGVLQRYYEAFSRVPNSSHHYVQEQIAAHAAEFVDFFFDEKTILYVCADGGSISKSIEKTIANCITQIRHITSEEALLIIKAYKGSGKYREDLWL